MILQHYNLYDQVVDLTPSHVYIAATNGKRDSFRNNLEAVWFSTCDLTWVYKALSLVFSFCELSMVATVTQTVFIIITGSKHHVLWT